MTTISISNAVASHLDSWHTGSGNTFVKQISKKVVFDALDVVRVPASNKIYHISESILRAKLLTLYYTDSNIDIDKELQLLADGYISAKQLTADNNNKTTKSNTYTCPKTGRTAAEFIQSVTRVAFADRAVSDETTDHLLYARDLLSDHNATKSQYIEVISQLINILQPDSAYSDYNRLREIEIAQAAKYKALADLGLTDITPTGRADWSIAAVVSVQDFPIFVAKCSFQGYAYNPHIVIEGLTVTVLLREIDLNTLDANLAA